jgi:predicted metal-dependent hydrolase
LPPQALEGVEKFNAGEFYKQHDLFEALWVAEQGPVRDLYRAILQVGVAYYQILRGNHRGALKMLLRSIQWLLILPDACQGVDVKQLRADAARVRAELERIGPADLATFDRGLLRPVKLISAPHTMKENQRD